MSLRPHIQNVRRPPPLARDVRCQSLVVYNTLISSKGLDFSQWLVETFVASEHLTDDEVPFDPLPVSHPPQTSS